MLSDQPPLTLSQETGMNYSIPAALRFTAIAASAAFSLSITGPATAESQTRTVAAASIPHISYHTVAIDGVPIFYRESGPKDAPVLLLLHGFPASSHMYRELIPALADRYHVVAPDFPGFGQSGMPSRDSFAYTFAHFADVIDQFTQTLKLDRYSLYVMDYGAPVGYR